MVSSGARSLLRFTRTTTGSLVAPMAPIASRVDKVWGQSSEPSRSHVTKTVGRQAAGGGKENAPRADRDTATRERGVVSAGRQSAQRVVENSRGCSSVGACPDHAARHRAVQGVLRG
jgi:hypothetical protein